MSELQLRPQPGKQEKFLASQADIAVFGGAAGSGKSFALLLENLYDKDNGQFRSVVLSSGTSKPATCGHFKTSQSEAGDS